MPLPQVLECAVIGVPDDRWGEAVKALIVVKHGESLTDGDVIALCKAKLGGVKSPKSVEFVPEIPKTPADRWGEAVKALIVVKHGESLTDGDVIAHCKAKLGGVKSPKSVEFVPEIPKTPAGKLDRKTMRKQFWATVDREVH